nr:Silver-binding protein silE precursor [Klebsiella pneumoniae]
MMGTGCTVNASRPATSFAAMNEHERAAVAHEFTNNGQSAPIRLWLMMHTAA